ANVNVRRLPQFAVAVHPPHPLEQVVHRGNLGKHHIETYVQRNFDDLGSDQCAHSGIPPLVASRSHAALQRCNHLPLLFGPIFPDEPAMEQYGPPAQHLLHLLINRLGLGHPVGYDQHPPPRLHFLGDPAAQRVQWLIHPMEPMTGNAQELPSSWVGFTCFDADVTWPSSTSRLPSLEHTNDVLLAQIRECGTHEEEPPAQFLENPDSFQNQSRCMGVISMDLIENKEPAEHFAQADLEAAYAEEPLDELVWRSDLERPVHQTRKVPFPPGCFGCDRKST